MITVRLSQDISACFPTLMLVRVAPELGERKSEFVELARSVKAKSAGRQISNHGGWQSGSTIFQLDHPILKALSQVIFQAVVELSAAALGRVGQPVSVEGALDGWLNINGPGDYNIVHSHPIATWSGVYYIDVGSGDATRPHSGDIEFTDPRGTVDQMEVPVIAHGGARRIKPVDGMMILFPGYLPHFVHPYTGAGERVTLAFNVQVRSVK